MFANRIFADATGRTVFVFALIAALVALALMTGRDTAGTDAGTIVTSVASLGENLLTG